MPLAAALAYVEALRAQPRAVMLRPGERHWSIFTALCQDGDARGNLVADAYHAALAVEVGAEFVTTDRDFARSPGLRWRVPLRYPCVGLGTGVRRRVTSAAPRAVPASAPG
jgi:hypothetical protein